MKPIKTAEQHFKKTKNRKAWLAILMLVILIGSTAGYAFYFVDSESTNLDEIDVSGQTSDEQRLIQSNGFWFGQYNGQYIPFTNHVNETKNIEVSTDRKIADYVGKVLYVDSKNSEVDSEISSSLGKYSERVQRACYGSCEENIPEKGCDSNLIVFRESEKNKVYQEENCIFIDGDLKAVDAFLYKIFEIE